MPEETALERLKRLQGGEPAPAPTPAAEPEVVLDKPKPGESARERLSRLRAPPSEEVASVTVDVFNKGTAAQDERAQIPAVDDDDIFSLATHPGTPAELRGGNRAIPQEIRDAVASEMGINPDALRADPDHRESPVMKEYEERINKLHAITTFKGAMPWIKNKSDALAFENAANVKTAALWVMRAIDAGDITGEYGGKFTSEKWTAAKMTKEKWRLALDYRDSVNNPDKAKELIGKLQAIGDRDLEDSRDNLAWINHLSDVASGLSLGMVNPREDINDELMSELAWEQETRTTGHKWLGAAAQLIPAMFTINKMSSVGRTTAMKMGVSPARATLMSRATATGAWTASQGGTFASGFGVAMLSPTAGARVARMTRNLPVPVQKAAFESIQTIAIGGTMNGFDTDDMMIDAVIGIMTSGLQSRRSFLREVHDVQKAYRMGGPDSPRAVEAMKGLLARIKSRIKGDDGGDPLDVDPDSAKAAVEKLDESIKIIEKADFDGGADAKASDNPDDAPPMARRKPAQGEEPVTPEKVEAEIGGPDIKVEPDRVPTPDHVPRSAEDLPLGDPERTTALANRVAAAERATRGLGPVADDARRSFGTAWDRALEELDFDPGSNRALAFAESVAKDPRALGDSQQLQLLATKIKLLNDHADANKRVSASKDNPEQLAEALLEVGRVEGLLNTVDVAIKRGGTETARGLSVRQMMASLDYTEAGVIERLKSASKDGEINPKARKEVLALQKKLEAQSKELEELRVRAEELQSQQVLMDALDLERVAANRIPEAEFTKVITSKRFGEKNKFVTRKRLEEIDARLREKWSGLSSNPFADPETFKLVAEKLAFYAEAIGRGVAGYTQAAVHLFGEKVKDRIPDLYRESRRIMAAAARSGAAKSLDEQIKAGLAKNDRAALHPAAKRLMRDLVKSGVDDPEKITDEVYAALKKHDETITRREARDAISGHGIFREAKRSTIAAKEREIVGILNELSKIEDLENGKVPRATGDEHVAPGLAERLLKQETARLKAESGLESPGKGYLRMPIDTVRRQAKNRIEELNEQIAKGKRARKSSRRITTNDEVKALIKERDALNKMLNEIDPPKRPKMTDEQKAAAVGRGLQRRLKVLRKKVADGDTSSTKGEGVPESPSMAAARSEIKSLNAQLEVLRNANDPTRLKRIATKSLEARLENQLARIRRRIAEDDLEQLPPDPVEISARARRLQAEIEISKKALNERIIKERLANASLGRKAVNTAAEIVATGRALVTAGDASAFGRQGWLLLAANPKFVPGFIARTAKSIFGGERRFEEVEAETKGHPDYRDAVNHGVDFTKNDPTDLRTAEEVYMSRWAEKIPIIGKYLVAPSSRGYVAPLNWVRVMAYANMKRGLIGKRKATEVEKKAIANFVNNATGRGTIAGFEQSMGDLARLFFAPRLMASRFSIATGMPMITGGKGVGIKMSARVRLAIASEYVKFGMTWLAMSQLVELAGGEVESDPRSSDFGKWRFGRTRIDGLAGLSQTVVLIARSVSGETKSSTTGKVVKNRGPDKDFRAATPSELATRFLFNKLAPLPAEIREWFDQRTFDGETPSIGGSLANMALPFSVRDMMEAFEDEGVGKATALSLMALFGFGLAKYDAPGHPDNER